MVKPKKKRGRPRKNPLPQPLPLPELMPPSPTPENPVEDFSASPSAESSNNDAAAAAEQFAQASAGVIADAGAGPELPAAAEPAVGAVSSQVTIPHIGTIEISQDGVKRFIDAPFNGIAKAARDEKYKLEDFERELIVPGVTGCLNRYLPEWLKRTNNPELMVLLVGLSVYGVRIGAGAVIEKILAKFTSAPDTATADSPALTPLSGSPESARPSPPARGFEIPRGASGSTR